MKKIFHLQELDRVDILTLQDNFIEITAMDNTAIVSRARFLVGGEVKNSIRAEHGFSAIVRTTRKNKTHTLLFDFGFSRDGVAANARALGVTMRDVEVMVLSHGHSDHFLGFEKLVKMIGRKGIQLILHPAAFRKSRYLKLPGDVKAFFPERIKSKIEKAAVNIVETKLPYPLLEKNVLFLVEIERTSEFEKGTPNAFFVKKGGDVWDPIEDDTGIAMHLKGKGLVILTGCAHSGIVNTVHHARKVTGIENVHAVIGGFHLSGPIFEPIVGKTIEELKKINPAYVVPTHCTGRKTIAHVEKEMPDRFLLNMSGTKLTFTA